MDPEDTIFEDFYKCTLDCIYCEWKRDFGRDYKEVALRMAHVSKGPWLK